MGKTIKTFLKRNVYLTSLTSFFTDISSEMIYPLLQAFLKSILAGAQVLLGPLLGLIEGLAESTASLLKLYSGYFSDKIKKRKPLAIFGYTTSAFSKLLLFLSHLSWIFVLAHRLLDRVGKGFRSAPRDALLAESVNENERGLAFGLQRGFDFAGATLGVLISFFLVQNFLDISGTKLLNPHYFYPLFLISVIPAFIAVIFLVFTHEPSLLKNNQRLKLSFKIKNYPKSLKFFFLAQFIFTLGNSSNQFLFLRSTDLGSSLSTLILLYLVFNLSTTAFSTCFGKISDKVGRKKILVLGYILYSLIYASFGLITTNYQFLLWLIWPLYGIYYAMTESVERALVADLAETEYRGTALGYYHTLTGIGLFPASLLAGLLYAVWPCAPFLFGSVLAFTAALIIISFVKDKTPDYKKQG